MNFAFDLLALIYFT